MSKLHEILAVEGELEGLFKKMLIETQKTFSDKPAFFIGSERHYTSFLDEKENDVEASEHQELVTTVKAKLLYLCRPVVRFFDAVLQKDTANQAAVADITIGDKVLATGVPATTLLGYENKMKLMRPVFAAIPTLQSGVKWIPDPDMGEDIYKQEHPAEAIKARKVRKYVTVTAATEHHPADVREEMNEEKTGKYIKTTWSGMVTPARKSEILERFDKLARAIKQARQRANCVEVKNVTVGQKLIDYILG